MAKRKTDRTKSSTALNLKELGVDDAYYLISVSLEKFDMKGFVDAVGGYERHYEMGGLTFAPCDPETGQYYIRFNWYTHEGEVRLRIEYIQGKREHAEDEKPPYAEDFMAWLGAFFKFSSAQAHTHAHLDFPIRARRSLFPLPLQTAMVGDPVIEGISLRLPTKPEGVSRVKINMGVKLWHLEIVADKRITFKTFSIHEDIASYTETLKTLLEETL